MCLVCVRSDLNTKHPCSPEKAEQIGECLSFVDAKTHLLPQRARVQLINTEKSEWYRIMGESKTAGPSLWGAVEGNRPIE